MITTSRSSIHLLLITTILIIIGSQHAAGQQGANGIPDDVELIDNDAATTGTDKLGTPFNNRVYQSYPVVLLDPQLVRPRGAAVAMFFRQMRSRLASQVTTTCSNLLQPRPAFRAAATLFGDNAEGGPMGTVVFAQHPLGSPLMVTINATGMPAGKHAVHIHAFGDLKEGCKSTGPHLRHILIGNVEVKEDGKLEINFHSPYLTLFGPNKGIIGRSIVIHEKPIEYNRFPDIRGYPIVPTLNDQSVQAEEMAVGAFVACGIITITDN